MTGDRLKSLIYVHLSRIAGSFRYIDYYKSAQYDLEVNQNDRLKAF